MELRNAMISRGDDPEAAADAIRDMRRRVMQGEDPEMILYENGLEPDYVFDIL